MAVEASGGLCKEAMERLEAGISTKRPRGDPNDDEELKSCDSTAGEEFVRRADLEAILGGYTKQNVESNQANMENINANTAALVRNYDNMQQVRFGKIENDMAEVKGRQDKVEVEQRTLRSQLEALGKSLAVAVSTPPEKMAEADAFSRQVDLSIFRINTSVLVSKLEVASALAPWMEEAGLQATDYTVAGSALAKQFVLQLLGEGGLATRMAEKAGLLLRRRRRVEAVRCQEPRGGRGAALHRDG